MSELLYSPAAYGLDMSVRNMPKPRARISPQVCLKCHILIILMQLLACRCRRNVCLPVQAMYACHLCPTSSIQHVHIPLYNLVSGSTLCC